MKKGPHYLEQDAHLGRTDGESFEATYVVAPFTDKTTSGYVITFRDITQRRRLEEQIIAVSGREQRRIGQDLHDGLGQHLTGIRCRLPNAAGATALR